MLDHQTITRPSLSCPLNNMENSKLKNLHKLASKWKSFDRNKKVNKKIYRHDNKVSKCDSFEAHMSPKNIDYNKSNQLTRMQTTDDDTRLLTFPIKFDITNC